MSQPSLSQPSTSYEGRRGCQLRGHLSLSLPLPIPPCFSLPPAGRPPAGALRNPRNVMTGQRERREDVPRETPRGMTDTLLVCLNQLLNELTRTYTGHSERSAGRCALLLLGLQRLPRQASAAALRGADSYYYYYYYYCYSYYY